MKRITTALLTLSLALLFCGFAFAEHCFNAKGSTIVPGLITIQKNGGRTDTTNISLSNITDSAVTCRVTIYDHDGNSIAAEYGNVYSGDSRTIATGTDTFDIPAHSTRIFQFYKVNSNRDIYGHAIIDWTSANENLRKALVGTARHYYWKGDSTWATSTAVNNGQPF